MNLMYRIVADEIFQTETIIQYVYINLQVCCTTVYLLDLELRAVIHQLIQQNITVLCSFLLI